MMKLDRYDLDTCDRLDVDGIQCSADLILVKDGDWVKWEDVEELLDQLDELLNCVDRARSDVADVIDGARR